MAAAGAVVSKIVSEHRSVDEGQRSLRASRRSATACSNPTVPPDISAIRAVISSRRLVFFASSSRFQPFAAS